MAAGQVCPAAILLFAGERERARGCRVLPQLANNPWRHSAMTTNFLAFPCVLVDEVERDLGHFMPAVVDGQRVPAVRYFVDLGHTRILLLLLEGGMGNRPRHSMVILARNDQQWSAIGIYRIDFGFKPFACHSLRTVARSTSVARRRRGTDCRRFLYPRRLHAIY